MIEVTSLDSRHWSLPRVQVSPVLTTELRLRGNKDVVLQPASGSSPVCQSVCSVLVGGENVTTLTEKSSFAPGARGAGEGQVQLR